MKAVVLSLLIGAAYAGIKCNWQTPSFKLKQQTTIPLLSWGVSWSGIELPHITECGSVASTLTGVDITDNFACASTKFEGSYKKDAINFWTGKRYESTWEYESETKSCALKKVCENLAGGSNKCQYAEYSYTKWQPTSCDEAADFDPITKDFNTKISLSCCDDANYCNADTLTSDHFSSCTEAPGFKGYIEKLNDCWTTVKRGFYTDLVCDNGGVFNGDIISWSNNCTEDDGSWKAALRGDKDCRYRASCAPEMRAKMKEFGECACTAAKDAGYTGDFIGTALEGQWDKFCPNIELSCSESDSVAQIIYKYFKVKYNFAVALAKSAITEEKIAAIKAKIADRLNVDPGLITIEFSVSVSAGTTRRLLAESTDMSASVDVEDYNTKTYIEQQLNDQLATEIGTAVDATVTKTSTTTDEVEEDVVADDSSAAFFNVNVVLFLCGLSWLF